MKQFLLSLVLLLPVSTYLISQEVDEESVKKPNTVTNNALFVGSTSELSKMLKDGFLDKK